MKKAIRIIDGIFALCLVIIYSLVAFGNFVLPDKITAGKRCRPSNLFGKWKASHSYENFQQPRKFTHQR